MQLNLRNNHRTSTMSQAGPLPLETGGAVRPGKTLYVHRPEEEHLLASTLAADAELISLIAPRQTGKTSLLYRLAADFMSRPWLNLDLKVAVGQPDGTNDDASKWVRQLLGAIWKAYCRTLDVANIEEFGKWWSSQQEHNRVDIIRSFFLDFFVCQPGIKNNGAVIVFDEFDIIHQHGAYTNVLFDALRVIYGSRDIHKLSFILSGVNPPHHLIKGAEQSNFSIGMRITLPDFSEPALYAQYLPYVTRWIPDAFQAGEFIEAVVNETGGQPYLTNVLLARCLDRNIRQPGDVAQEAYEFVDEVKRQRLIEPHFDIPVDILRAYPNDALDSLRAIDLLTESGVSEAEIGPNVLAVLRTAGLVRSVGTKLHLKSRIYRLYYDNAWIANTRTALERTRRSPVEWSKRRAEKERLLIINCGGTIGMELQRSGELGRPTDIDGFFKRFPEIHEVARIDPLPFSSMDGINFAPEDWKELIHIVFQNLHKGYAGIVICMGTDSLSYAAAAMAFALGRHVDRPIVFTGAQVPNHLEHSDASQNLLRSCLIAADGRIREVCVAYGDSVFRGVRAEKKDDYRFDGFHSPTYYPLAVITERIEYRYSPEAAGTVKEKYFYNDFAGRIFKWSYVPGVPCDLFDRVLEGRPQGIVMQTPGVGNVPTAGRANVLDFIERATDQNIPVLITGLYPSRPENISSYTPAKAPLLRGAISGGAMAEPAAIVKFMWLIAQAERSVLDGTLRPENKVEAIRQLMQIDEIGELTL